MKKAQIIALDKDGEVVYNETTNRSYYLTELACHFDRLKLMMHTGRVDKIIIEKAT